ncbi:MAG: tubulin-like doman-containing protein [bacterium]
MKDYTDQIVSFNHVSPTFFIGLGGSGSDVVNRIASKLKGRWNWNTLENLIHFFAVDTNTHDLARQENVPRDNRILISDFDKRAYIDAKRGKGHQEPDPFVTQWVHDWYEFRGTRGAGAGQIRVESRLSLHYQLEQDRGKIIQRLVSAMNTARDHDNPYRKSNPPQFNVFIYGSVAGGTGSGSFIPMAYLAREIISSQGWIPKVFGTLIMPSLFVNDVPGALHPDINANGYAALKELEHLMQLGTEGSATKQQFHYNPLRSHQPFVTDKPYDFVYIADKPTLFEVAAYKNAIADAAYLLLYSPILGAQASDYDNYEKHQKGLVGGYSVYYGSNGCSVLLLPDHDLLEYCALEYAAKAMGDYLLFQTKEAEQFAINFNDPKFKRLSKQAQAEEIDRKFVGFVDYMARRELEDEIQNGPYQAVRDLKTPTGGSLITEFDVVVDQFTREISTLVDLHTVSANDIIEQSIKVDGELNDLRGEVNRSRGKARAAWEVTRQDLRSGQMIRAFFQKHSATPYAQRVFLIQMKEALRKRIDELTGKLDGIRSQVDLDSDAVTSEIKKHRDTLVETAKWTLGERLKRRNEDFEFARTAFVQYFNGDLVDGNRAVIVDEFALEFLREAIEHFEMRLESFRAVAVDAVEAIEALKKEANDARITGRFAHGDGQSNAYSLDVEALQEVGGDRLWDLFFHDRFVSNGRDLSYFDETEIFDVITDAFNPRVDETGRRLAKTSREITNEIRAALVDVGRKRLGPTIVGTRKGGTDLTEKGLLLWDALQYEARYHFVRQYERDGSMQEPTQAQINDYLKTKLRFCDTKAHPLATFEEVEDARVINSRVALVGVHPAYRDSLGKLLEEVLPQSQNIPNWADEKAIVFYRANLGVPLFYYRRTNLDLKAAYDRVMAKKPAERGYPLHIDSNWEESLPNLDPNEGKADERANRDRAGRVGFAVGFATGLFVQDSDGVHWQLGTFGGVLGADRVAAYKAIDKLDDRTRRRLEERMEAAVMEASRNLSSPTIGLVDSYLKILDETIWKLEQSADSASSAEVAFLKEEETLLAEWRNALG